jgi:DNA (cytosine-5)-methyltransferase 1
MSTYFNEIDPYAAAWLGNLFPAAVIDRRSIADVSPDDVMGHQRCHFFGGIGGWEYALDLAGWPADWPIWSGSCPCQPFSAAGQRAGTADARHLWPAFFRLIAAVRPECVVGEQVGGAGGRAWLAGVHADLAGIGYQFGAVDLPAACVGAPHIRQRLYWVAHTQKPRWQELHRPERTNGRSAVEPGGHRNARGLADAERHDGRPDEPGRRPQERGADGRPGSGVGRLGDTTVNGVGPLDRQSRQIAQPQEPTRGSSLSDPWSSAALISCADGRARRAQPGIFPLAYGLPAALDGAGPISRVGALKGAGNAIVPQLAALFIRAFMEAMPMATN